MFAYISIAIRDPIMKKGRFLLIGFTLPHFCTCPKTESGFQMSYDVVLFVFNDLR